MLTRLIRRQSWLEGRGTATGRIETVVCWVASCLLLTLFNGAASALDDDLFERRIRPLLVDHCLECHGPSEQESGLRLDSRPALLQGGDGGPAIVSGQPGESRLMAAVERQGDLAMPPDQPLDDASVEALRQWIKAGAPWPASGGRVNDSLSAGHWAWQPISRPNLLRDQDLTWAQRRGDGLLLQALADRGLAPSALADRRTLLRRLSYDLRGLPPDPEEMERFLQDGAPDALSRLVDRWLASPRYGEQWARHWLDVARYADNKGYVFFEKRDYPWAYTYRDYVIKSLNEDITYDRFVLEQLAADKLTDLSSPSDLAALGFLTVGGHFINNTHDIIDDRIDVVTRGLLGLTVACARCHDHKYDPLSQADYYGLYGVFSSSVEPLVPPPLDPTAASQLTDYNIELERLEQELVDFVTGKYEGLVNGARTRVDEYLNAVHQRRAHPTAEDFMLIADPNDINPAMITRWESYLKRVATGDHPVWGAWVTLRDLPTEEWTQQAQRLLAEPHSTWNRVLAERLVQAKVTDVAAVAAVYGDLFREVDGQWQQAQSVDSATPSSLADPDLEALRLELYGDATPADLPPQLDWGFLSLFPDRATQNAYKELLGALEKWLVDPPEAPPRAMVMLDHPRPSDAPIFLRGNPHRPGPIVARRFLATLGGEDHPFTQGSGRLELAQAIIDPQNPLTDRVLVNRFWTHLMGAPLVRTPGDFGLRSEPPSLPQVLDEGVVEFRRGHRSLKPLIRTLVLSSTYQQQSSWRENSGGVDPENRLWWRQLPKRLQFEAMRDTLLADAGRLSARIGGPSEDLLSQLGQRRTLYAYIDRLDVAPVLTTFDFPNPAATSSIRLRTTVPPQALYWMNRDHMITVAEEVVRRTDRPELSVEQRLTRLFELIWARRPSDEERAWANEFLIAETHGDSDDVAGDDAGEDSAHVPPERWIQLTHALLMSNETVFID